MASNITRRNAPNIVATQDTTRITTRFNNMLYDVDRMIRQEGPIYSTWIRFQLGKSNPITFDTSSTSLYENLIASLQFNKCGAGSGNDFTLEIKYDPFNYGQQSKDKIEALDEYIAQAMSADELETDQLRGTLQYGYNYTKDNNLVSPRYEFYLTDADSQVTFDSGMTSYTFKGVSYISTDCEFNASFTDITNWKFMDIINWTLFYHYGSNNKRPKHIGQNDTTSKSALGYAIDIPERLFTDSLENISVPARSEMSPWQYCQDLMRQYNLLKSQKESGKYDSSDLPASKIPRYVMWITDQDGERTIHIDHCTPDDGSQNNKINFDFTWSKNSNNIITGWHPQVDLKLYLIRKMNYLREVEKLNKARDEALAEIEADQKSTDELSNIVNKGMSWIDSWLPDWVTLDNKITDAINGGIANRNEGYIELKNSIIQKYQEKVKSIDNELDEFYDAQLELIGIPADVPLSAEITVKPVVLESISRTAGVYMIKSATDNINNQGVFTTTLDLWRIRKL